MTDSSIRRILVPVDFSEASAEALRVARSLAAALGASIEVVHVMEPPSGLLSASQAPELTPAEARARLQELAAGSGSGGVAVTARVEDGDARTRIVALAEEQGFDLIAMGTQGRTGRPLALVGSVAESVIRTSTRPVLTVRARSDAGGGGR